MGNYTILGGSENPRRGGQARNLTTNVPKILDLKSSSEQIFYENCRWVPLIFIIIITCLQLLEESDRKLFQKNKHRQLSPSTLHATTSKT